MRVLDVAPRQWVSVAHGARDGYQGPLALADAGLLSAHVTDWYTPLDREWCRTVVSAMPSRISALMRRRFRPGLPSRLVAVPMRERLQAIRLRGGADERTGPRLGAYAGRLARRRDAHVLAYSYHANEAFAAYAGGSGARVLVQVQAHPFSVRAMLQQELARYPELATELGSELELAWDSARLARLAAEPLAADHVIAPSSYAASTLRDHGVHSTDISVLPYGVDAATFHPSARSSDSTLRVLFVGQLIHKKGLRYLFDAWRDLSLEDAELQVVGHGDLEALRHHAPAGVVLRGIVRDREELRALYARSDVLCVPSLSDGFGHVYLEALACGTPVIGTETSGAPDVVEDSVNGFIVPSRDSAALARTLRWCAEHGDDLRLMRVAARRRAEQSSWERYRARLVDILNTLDETHGAA